MSRPAAMDRAWRGCRAATLLGLLGALLGCRTGRAEPPDPPRVDLLPVTQPVPTNGRLLLHSNAGGIAVLEMVRRGRPMLGGDGHPIDLRVEWFERRRFHGDYERALVMLAPVTPLRPRAHYRLELAGLTARDRLLWDAAFAPEKPEWGDEREITSGAGADRSPVRWSARPQASEVVVNIEAPPWVWFETVTTLPVAPMNDILAIRVEIQGGGKRWSFLEPVIDRGDVMEGVVLARSTDPLVAGERYVARLTAIDRGGNETPAPAAVTFTPSYNGGDR